MHEGILCRSEGALPARRPAPLFLRRTAAARLFVHSLRKGKREEQQLTPGGYMSKPPLSPAALACSALGMAVFKIKAMFSRISSLL